MPSDDAWSVEVLRTVQANGNLLTRNKRPAVNKVRRASERRTAPRGPSLLLQSEGSTFAPSSYRSPATMCLGLCESLLIAGFLSTRTDG